MTVLPDENSLAYSMAGIRRTNPFDRRRSFASRLMQSGADASPVQHPLQGAARLAQALVGGYLSNRADEDEREATKAYESKLALAMAEPDPQKRIALLSATNPDLGARLSGQMAIEQAKLGQQQQGLQSAAQNFGGSFGPVPSGSPPSAPTQLGVNQGAAPPGGNAGFANNVGNIRATNINWQDKGQPHNGFETFGTPQAGANAMAQNLQAYVKAQPNMTVADAIKKWAPPNENNTAAYIRGLAESTGINPGMPLAQVLQDQALAATLMDGIGRIEKGGLPQGFTADTFMTAAGPGAPPQIAQGSADASGNPMPPPGMPPAPAPGAVTGPTMVAPSIPDVPRPQPTQQQLAQYQRRLASGEFGSDPREAPSRARAALDAELDRDWAVQRDRAKMQFGQETTLYNEQRKLDNEKNNPKFTEDANKAHAYALRLSRALPALEQMGADGYPGRIDRAVTNLPVLGNTLAGPRGERFDQLSRDIINAILRRESGAVISEEEFSNARKQYIPQPGDAPETVQLKLDNIRTQLKAFADTSNRTPDTYSLTGQRGATNRSEAVPTPATAAPTPGVVEGGYRFKGGNPADQRNWERVQ